MRILIGGEKPRFIDMRVALGSRQAGMAEQLLNRTQIAAACQQMCGKAVAEGVWCGGFRQPERLAQLA
jgi:hypothetical protein